MYVLGILHVSPRGSRAAIAFVQCCAPGAAHTHVVHTELREIQGLVRDVNVMKLGCIIEMLVQEHHRAHPH